jgi:hypothetical protein
MRALRWGLGTFLALPIVLVLIGFAHAQGSGTLIRVDCTTITSPTTATVCYDITLLAWRAWNGSAWVTLGGSPDGAAGRVQLSSGAGAFASDSVFTHDSAADHTTVSGLSVQLTTKTANYTATRADQFIAVSASSGPVTITLPPAATQKGLLIYVKKTDSSANAVTVARSSSDTIDGDTTAVLNSQYTSVGFVSDGISQWLIY